MKITENLDERSIGDYLKKSIGTVWQIPFFQRKYRWKKSAMQKWVADIVISIDDEDAHFIGPIIVDVLKKRTTMDVEVAQVIDGQQRLTTSFLACLAWVELAYENGFDKEANKLLKVLLHDDDDTLYLRLQPSREDLAGANKVLKRVFSIEGVRKYFQKEEPDYFPVDANSRASNKWFDNFKVLRAEIAKVTKTKDNQEGISLDVFLTGMLDNFRLIEIAVSDPRMGPAIFNNLNSKQEAVTVGELVRNQIFALGDLGDTEKLTKIHDKYWEPFFRGFEFEPNKNHFENYFFPLGLISSPSIKKSDVFDTFRRDWRKRNLKPSEVIQELGVYQKAYMDLQCGTNSQNHSKSLSLAIRRLYDAHLPSSLFSFLMKLSVSVHQPDSKLKENEAVKILDIIERFLVRRALCGIEPSGLHAVFKSMWNDCNGRPTVKSVIENIKRHRTVFLPNDELVSSAVKTRPLYGSRICRYFILERDRALGGDDCDLEFHIEHVMPNSRKHWKSIFSEDQHSEFIDTAANLIPLTARMNTSLGDQPYDLKKKEYTKDSRYKSAREFGKKYKSWTPQSLKQRALELSKWTLERWPDLNT